MWCWRAISSRPWTASTTSRAISAGTRWAAAAARAGSTPSRSRKARRMCASRRRWSGATCPRDRSAARAGAAPCRRRRRRAVAPRGAHLGRVRMGAPQVGRSHRGDRREPAGATWRPPRRRRPDPRRRVTRRSRRPRPRLGRVGRSRRPAISAPRPTAARPHVLRPRRGGFPRSPDPDGPGPARPAGARGLSRQRRARARNGRDPGREQRRRGGGLPVHRDRGERPRVAHRRRRRAGAGRRVPRLGRALTVVAPPEGALPVVFTPAGLAALLLPVTQALSGKAVLQGISPLAGKDGQGGVFDAAFSLSDDATCVGRPASRPIDDECVPSRVTRLVERGVVQRFIYDLETAARAKAESTGRVKDAAVAGNVYELWKRVGGFGNDARWTGSRYAPSVLLEGVSVARR